MKRYDIEGEEKYIASQYHMEKTFWSEELSGDWIKSSFPGDFEETGKDRRDMESLPFQFPPALEAKILKAANNADSRLHMILTAGMVQLLYKYTGTRDILIGIPIYRQEVEGDFVNTILTLRHRLADNMNFKDLLNQVKQIIIEANQHLNYPVEAIPNDLGIPYSPDDDFPLFDVILLLENVHNKDYIHHIRTNMIFTFNRTGDHLEGTVEYNSYRYKKATVKRVIGYFCFLLQETLFNPNSAISDISPLTAEEKKEMLFDFNQTRAQYPADLTVLQLFLRQVEQTPHHIALVCDRQQLTYKQLSTTVNGTASLLIGRGLKVNAIVGIMGKRSIGIVAGILGILKAGGTYLPINAIDPEDRIRFILEDSSAPGLITHKYLVDHNPSLANIDTLESIIYTEDLTEKPVAEVDSPAQPNDHIYVIYTSGTTGKPKGVLVTHRNVVNYICWAAKTYVKNERINFPLYTSIAFDLTVTSLYTPLITGNAVVVYESDANEALIERVVTDNQVEIVKITPSQLKVISDRKREREISSIKRLILGGEALTTQLATKIYENFNGKIEIYNEYGPTETTVGSMIYQFNPQEDKGRLIPIGKPANNTQIYLLNENLEPVPMGAAGEIYISGDGVAQGYLNRPELTAEKFDHDLWDFQDYQDEKEKKNYQKFFGGSRGAILQKSPSGRRRLYKTGDLARWLPDGNIEFLNRKDNQVKIRGYRVEIGEIESRLLIHEEIDETLVIARQDKGGENYLCAYIVSDKELPVSDLREFLSPGLPDYMVPSFFVKIDKIPLTSNGKVDMKALPEPRLNITTVIAPRDHQERKMAKIWAEILYIPEPDISIDLNFFESGGHSLSATILMARIHKTFNARLQLVDIFKYPNIRGLVEVLRDFTQELFASIEPAEKKEYYPLSSPQKRFYILQQLEPNSTAYNIPVFLRLTGKLDQKKFEKILNQLVQRHESLRTSLALIGDEPQQRVYDQVTLDLKYDEPGREEGGTIEKIIGNFSRPFHLSQPPLMRAGLIRAEEEQYILMVDIHHIVSDALSMALILENVMALYEEKNLPGLRIQYKDYTCWQIAKKQGESLKKQEDFWLKEFAGEIPVLNLPTDFPRPMNQSFTGGEVTFEIGQEETKWLNLLAVENGATLFMVFLAIYSILLVKLSGQEDIVMGIPVAGRPHVDLEPLIGLFINTLPIRNHYYREKTFREFLDQLREKAMQAFDNQDYQFEDLVETIGAPRDLSRNPLFDAMLVWDYVKISDLQIPGVNVKRYYYETKTAKFDLTLEGLETEDEMKFRVEYCSRLFKKSTIERFLKYFKKIISSVIENPDEPIRDIEIILKEEKKQIIYEFNDTKTAYPGGKSIQEWFAEQAERTPDRTAIYGCRDAGLHRETQITYRELNEKSHQLAEILKEKGIMTNNIAAIMMERSIRMIIGILAILKSGGAYLPIETDYPAERLKYILEDSKVKLLLSKQEFYPYPVEGVELVDLENLGRVITDQDKDNLAQIVSPETLAYVLYTSGSTGNPKGVMVDQGSVVNILLTLFDSYPMLENDVYLMKTSYVFDVSVSELFGWFWQGGRLVLLENEGEKEPQTILNTIEREGVTHINFVPSMFGAFLDFMELQNLNRMGSLKYIFLAGEALPPGMVKKFKVQNSSVMLENIYGPTEATIYASKYSLQHWEGGDDKRIPIGKPLNNIELYVVDSSNHLQPVGIPGELCIAGAGTARGYLNNPELTAEKFCLRRPGMILFEGTRGLAPLLLTLKRTDKGYMQPGIHAARQLSPHHTTQYLITPSPHSPIYRTGDLARWQPDGNIEFFGRMDLQVKVRGFRVELEEIETHLKKHEKIQETVVISKQDHQGNSYLAAYVVPTAAHSETYEHFKLETANLREYLLKRLPHYMVPSHFVVLDALPLTSSGKIDRKALPDPKETALASGFEYLAPRNQMEKKLLETWGRVLGRDDIGVNDDFFMIGGDSIKAIQIAARMNRLGYTLLMRDIFRFSTISQLAPIVKKMERIPEQSIITGVVSLTPVQKWFFEIDDTDHHHFNHAVLLYSQERLEEKALREVLRKIQEHHDALRMTFKRKDGEWIQTNQGLDYPLSLGEVDFRGISQDNAAAEIEKNTNRIQASIDLETGPLMKAALFHLDDGDRLIIVIHHLVIDGISWRILLEDIETLYRQYKKGEPLVLPLKSDSYKLWSEKLASLVTNDELLRSETYWAKLELSGLEPIKKDYEGENNYIKDTQTLTTHLSEEETTSLLTGINHAYGTEINDILLTSLGLAIKRTRGNCRVLIALEGHGREEILENITINRTLGWFTCIYPVILNMSYESDLSRQVKEVKENLRQVPDKGVSYGILRYLRARKSQEGVDFDLKPQVNFNYLGQVDTDLEQTSFRRANESVGELISSNRQRGYELEVSGIIIDQQLNLSISFNTRQYKTETIETLLVHYKTALNQIIYHCSARKERTLTPSDFTYKELSIEKVEDLQNQYPVPIEDLYPLSPMQAGILFHCLNEKDSSAYLMQNAWKIHGQLNVEWIEKSLNQLLKRHEILRTVFVHEGLDRPLQLVLENRDVGFYYEDLRQMGSDGEKNIFINKYKEDNRQKPFDFSRDLLMRTALIRTDEEEYELIWSFHHLLLDGWCMGIITTEFLTIYTHCLENRELRLPMATPYRTYIEWLEKQDKYHSKNYWAKYLEGYETKIGIPQTETVDLKGGTGERKYREEKFEFTLDSENTRRLNQSSAQHHVTLNNIIQTVWGIVLGNYSSEPHKDVVFGGVVSGRPPEIAGIESMVGLFINTLPVRIQYDENTSFKDLVQKTQRKAIESEPYQYYPLAQIQSLSVLKQDLLDHILAFENFPTGIKQDEKVDNIEEVTGNNNSKRSKGLSITFSETEAFFRTNFDLDITIIPGNTINVIFSYNANVYNRQLIRKVGKHFSNLLREVSHQMEANIKELKLTSKEIRKNILNQFMEDL